MAAVATVAINVDAANAVKGLDRVQTAAKGASSAFDQLSGRAKAVKAIVEAQQGSFAKASTVQGVFSARVLNTEAAMLAQIAALREVQKNVQLGGALYKKAGAQIEEYKNKIKAANTVTKETQPVTQAASTGVKGLGAALQSALGPLLTITTAFATLKAAVNTAFEGEAVEQRLKNLTSGTEEYNVALALAADSAQKFGLTQTQAGGALADVFSRLKGVGFGLKETSEIYQGFNTIAARSGLVGEEAAGAFFQLSQALGKGKLNGDEFVTIAERLPQLLDAIAQTTGASRGQLSQLAQEGKITSQVLFEALSGAANGADGLTNKLTLQQAASNRLKQATDNLLTSIGKVFAPAVTAGYELLSNAFVKINDKLPEIIANAKALLGPFIALGQVVLPVLINVFDGLLGNIKGVLQTAAFFATYVGILKAITLATKAWAIATQGLATAKKVAAVAAAALQAILKPASLAKTALAIAGAAAASVALGKAMDEAAKNTKKTDTESDNLSNKVDELLKKYSSLPPKIADSKEEAKRLKEAQKAVNDQIQQTIQSADRLKESLTANVESQLQISQARFNAEKAINDVLLQQAQSQLSAAQSQEERIKAAQNILTLTIEQAKLELQSTKATIAAELDKAKIAVTTAQLKERELTAIVNLAIAQGTVNDKFLEALNNQRDALRIAKLQFDTVSQVARQQGIAADAVFRGKVAAAEAAFQQNVLAKNTQESAKAASAYANEMERGANATERAASASSQLSGGFGFGEAGKNVAFVKAFNDEIAELNRSVGSYTIQQQRYNEVLAKFQQLAEQFNIQRARERIASAAEEFVSVTGLPVPFAEGGYVTRPTNAVVGEAGSEYVIPASKMQEAMQRYASGARGSSVIPASGSSSESTGFSTINPQVSITTGPVLQMNNESYVTKSDLVSATQQAAKQGANLALRNIQNSPSLRRNVGLVR